MENQNSIKKSRMKSKKNIVIIGAGPAGLAAAYELSVRNDIKCTIFEKSSQTGGLSKTVQHNGYRVDIGPHRFFTKNQRVEKLWNKVLDNDFMFCERKTRIYYNNIFFNYPLKAIEIPLKLGLFKTIQIGISYIKRHLSPLKPEDNFESWVRNRFGDMLYDIFFHEYTKKVWGVEPKKIDAEWAAQRIRSLSLGKVILDALNLISKGRQTSLISSFRYPRLGAGQMYEAMADKITESGSEIIFESDVTGIHIDDKEVAGVKVKTRDSEKNFPADYLISSMPLDELVLAFDDTTNDTSKKAAKELKYRSLVTVDLMFDSKIPPEDHWIYLNSSDVEAGRMNLFHNWSPEMVPSADKSSISLEYFCNEGDEIWNADDDKLYKKALNDITKIRFMEDLKTVDHCIVKYRKAYPCYLGNYESSLKVIRQKLDSIKNISAVGRYGQFRYNNMDHSIETGLLAAQRCMGKNVNPWAVNEEAEYHEERKV